MSVFDASFFKRLGFYLFGLSIGIVFLAFFFKKKTEETGATFCYLPNCRALKDMRSKPLVYSDKINALLRDGDLDTLSLHAFFTEGDVDFSNSDTQAKPCKTYQIDHETGNSSATLYVENCPDQLRVTDFRITDTAP